MANKSKILIIEDEKLIARDIKTLLEAKGYQILATVSSAAETFEILKNNVPDLILIDIRIDGGQDGIEIARNIKTLMDIPIIFLTAYPDQHYLERAKEINPAGYLLKPFNVRELEVTIFLALAKHDAEKKHNRSEYKYQQLFESIPIGLYHASSEGRFLDVNQTLVSILGYSSKEELLKEPVEARYFNANDHEQWLSHIQKEKALHSVQTQWKMKNGK